LRERFPRQSYTGDAYLSDVGYDLLTRLLSYNPATRISAKDALAHPYFNEEPRPQHPVLMPTYPSMHEGRRRRAHHKDPNRESDSADINDLRHQRDLVDGFFMA